MCLLKRETLALIACSVLVVCFFGITLWCGHARSERLWETVYDGGYMLVNDSKSAVKAKPQDACDFAWRADCLLLDGKPQRALADIDQAIWLMPNNSNFLLSKAKILAKLGRYREAVEPLNQVQRVQEGYWLKTGDTYRIRVDIQDWHGAIAELDQLIKQSPGCGTFYHYRSIARSNIGDFSGAAKDFQLSTTLDNNSHPLRKVVANGLYVLVRPDPVTPQPTPYSPMNCRAGIQ